MYIRTRSIINIRRKHLCWSQYSYNVPSVPFTTSLHRKRRSCECPIVAVCSLPSFNLLILMRAYNTDYPFAAHINTHWKDKNVYYRISSTAYRTEIGICTSHDKNLATDLGHHVLGHGLQRTTMLGSCIMTRKDRCHCSGAISRREAPVTL